MPLDELYYYLRSVGDRILCGDQKSAEILTQNGVRYVRSNEGTRWEPHYIWVRV